MGESDEPRSLRRALNQQTPSGSAGERRESPALATADPGPEPGRHHERALDPIARSLPLVSAGIRDTVSRIMSQHGSVAAVARLLREIEELLKHPSVTVELGHRGVNASITLLAVQGLVAYVEGNRRQAHDDLATVTEEIRARLDLG